MNQLGWLDALTLATAIGAGLVAGFFFAFSITVMKALGALPPEQGIAGMQSINVVVINPWFFAAFFGVAFLSLVMVGAALFRWSDPRAAYWLIGGLLYIVGTIVVTMVFNVPRNNVLARVAADSADGARYWADYLSTWTAWNHVRTVAPLAAAVMFAMALRLKS
jgi:uncharacterized membrane protein